MMETVSAPGAPRNGVSTIKSKSNCSRGGLLFRQPTTTTNTTTNACNNSIINQSRINLLNQIGFPWSMRPLPGDKQQRQQHGQEAVANLLVDRDGDLREQDNRVAATATAASVTLANNSSAPRRHVVRTAAATIIYPSGWTRNDEQPQIHGWTNETSLLTRQHQQQHHHFGEANVDDGRHRVVVGGGETDAIKATTTKLQAQPKNRCQHQQGQLQTHADCVSPALATTRAAVVHASNITGQTPPAEMTAAAATSSASKRIRTTRAFESKPKEKQQHDNEEVVDNPAVSLALVAGKKRIQLDWNEYYKLLCAYKEKNGHLDIAKNCITPEGIRLGKWIANQRESYSRKQRQVTLKTRKHVISDERIKLLNDIEFPWEVLDPNVWEKHFKLVQDFKKEFSHLMIAHDYETDGCKVGLWAKIQRKYYSRTMRDKCNKKHPPMRQDHMTRLNSIEFPWVWKPVQPVLKRSSKND